MHACQVFLFPPSRQYGAGECSLQHWDAHSHPGDRLPGCPERPDLVFLAGTTAAALPASDGIAAGRSRAEGLTLRNTADSRFIPHHRGIAGPHANDPEIHPAAHADPAPYARASRNDTSQAAFASSDSQGEANGYRDTLG